MCISGLSSIIACYCWVLFFFLFLRTIPGGHLKWSPHGSKGGAAFSTASAVLLWPYVCPGRASAAHARNHGLELHVRWRPTAAIPQVFLFSAWSASSRGLAHLCCALRLSHHWSEGAAGHRGTNASGATDTPGQAEFWMSLDGAGILRRTKSPLWRWEQQVALCCPGSNS